MASHPPSEPDPRPGAEPDDAALRRARAALADARSAADEVAGQQGLSEEERRDARGEERPRSRRDDGLPHPQGGDDVSLG